MTLDNTLRNYIHRYLILTCGLVIMSFGVAFSIKANMGISPISCLPYVLNLTNDFFTVGQYTMMMHVIFVLVQIFIYRRNYQLHQLLQIAVAVVLGLVIDLALIIVKDLTPGNYFQQVILFCISTFMVGFGMFLEIKGNVLMVAGEGMVKAIAEAVKTDFGKIKIMNDCTLVAISLAVGLIFSGKILGIREGTVLAAFGVGLVIKFCLKYFHFVDPFVRQAE